MGSALRASSLRDRRRGADVSLPLFPSTINSETYSSPLTNDPLLPIGGEGGIRTLEHLLGCYSLSRRAPSTTRPPLRNPN